MKGLICSMKKRILSVILTVAMLICMIPVGMVTVSAEQTETSTADWIAISGDNKDYTLKSGYYYVKPNTGFTTAWYNVNDTKNNGKGGLVIADNATVYIYVPKDVKLVCQGAPGNGQTPGTAGIYLPSSSKLYLLGEGTVVATGGDGGKGGNGGNAVQSITRRSTSASEIISETGTELKIGQKLQYARGGNGGYGGGGAGAGIGTAGGMGANGVEQPGTGYGYTISSDNDCSMTHYLTNSGLNGTDGKKGSDSVSAAAMGELHISNSLTVTATGGNAGAGGNGGSKSGYRWSGPIPMTEHLDGTSNTKYWPGGDYSNSGAAGAGRAGGGGGGGGGYAGASIGAGGASGAGGGAGGSGGGAIVVRKINTGAAEDEYHSLTNGGGGIGGAGGNAGKNGAGTQSSCYGVKSAKDRPDSSTIYNATTYHGGASGASGNAGSVGAENTTYDNSAEITYKITYNKADGTSSTDNYSVGSNTAVTLAENSGYSWQQSVYGKTYSSSISDFAKANTNTYDSGTDIILADVYGDIAFTAIANKYSVYFNMNGGEGGQSTPLTVTYDAAMPDVTVPTRTGYIFLGYFDAPVGGTKYYNADGTSAKVWDKTEESATLYAQWHEHNFVNGECECGFKQIAVPAAVEGLVFDGTEQTGVENGVGYTLAGNTEINAGTYTATATLLDGYVWEDGTTEDKVITWKIFSSQAPVIAGNLKTLYTDVNVEDNTITLTGYKNTNSIVVYAKGIDGKDVNVTMAGTPITKLSNGTGFVLTYKNWVKSGENVTTKITVDNRECTLVYKFEIQQTPVKDDIKTLRVYDIDVNETDKIVTLTSNADAPYINLYEYRNGQKSFKFELASSEGVEKIVTGQYKVYRPEGANQLTLPMRVTAGVLGTTDYTLVVNFAKSPFDPSKYISPIYGGLELKNDGEEDYILLSMTSGKDFVGFRAAGISGATLSFDPASADGVVDEYVSGGKTVQYRVYKSKNKPLGTDDFATVTGSISIKFKDGTEETYKIVFAFEPMSFSANALSATQVQSVEYDSATHNLTLNGLTTTAIYIRPNLTNGLKVSVKDFDGAVVSDETGIIIVNCPVSGVAKFTLVISNGEEIGCTAIFKEHCSFDDEGNIVGDNLIIPCLPITRGTLKYDAEGQLVCTIQAGKSAAIIPEKTSLDEEVTVELIKGVTYDEANKGYKVSTSVAGQHITMNVSGVKYDVLIAKS